MALADVARNGVLHGVRLLFDRLAQRSKMMAGVVKLVDQRQDDWKARVVEAHAVVQIASERHARLVDPIEEIAMIVAVWRDHAFVYPGHQNLVPQIRELREEIAFADHVS